MKLRIRFAVFLAKLAHYLLGKIGAGRGTALPGYLAVRIAPRLLAWLSCMVREKIIVTMGTNGKTTSNNLLCRALEAEGKKVICNRLGANMRNGIVSAFVLAAGRDGSIDADYACIEVDELAAGEVLSELSPDCIVLTNIFRDQLDRYGEIDIICQKIKEAILAVPKAVLVINSDDAVSYALACGCPNETVLYGINERAFCGMAAEGFTDSLFCRFCGTRLSYEFFHYGHLGIWHCPHCGAKRPAPICTVSDVRLSGGGCSFYLEGNLMVAQTDACYSVYNTLSAYTAAYAVHAPLGAFEAAVQSFDYGNHREEEFCIHGARVRLCLIKNPVGFQQKLAILQRDTAPKDIILQINDNAQDGKDVSWLWDVDFGGFLALHAATILTVGQRCYDMLLRLKYEDIPCEAADSIKAAVERLTKEGTKNLYVLSNYSGLYATNRMLRRLEGRKREDV